MPDRRPGVARGVGVGRGRVATTAQPISRAWCPERDIPSAISRARPAWSGLFSMRSGRGAGGPHPGTDAVPPRPWKTGTGANMMNGDESREVRIPIDGESLHGTLERAAGATGVVIFAHGAGSSRFSPRNRFVAGELRAAGVGTLLFDLLTEEEEADRANVFDIGLLADRLVRTTEWLERERDAAGQPIGYFGASTGAAAALVAAARLGDAIAAVVSRGGRPDLAGAH